MLATYKLEEETRWPIIAGVVVLYSLIYLII